MNKRDTSFTVPVLSLLPIIRDGVTGTTGASRGKLLDNLAALCVQNQGDVFATALDPTTATLYVASNHLNGVPDSAMNRLKDVRSHIGRASQDRNLSRQVFCTEQMMFSQAAINNNILAMKPAVETVFTVTQPGYRRSIDELIHSPEYNGNIIAETHEFLGKFLKQMNEILELGPVTRDNSVPLASALSALSRTLHYASKKSISDLVDIGLTRRINMLYLVNRMLAISNGIDTINKGLDPSYLDIIQRLTIKAVSHEHGTLVLDPLASRRFFRSFFLHPETEEVLDYFDKTFDERIAAPLQRAQNELRMNQNDPAADGNVFAAPVHPEVRLLVELHSKENAIDYIGVSELSCAPCYEFIFSHSQSKAGCRFVPRVLGSSNETTLLWGAPSMDCIAAWPMPYDIQLWRRMAQYSAHFRDIVRYMVQSAED